MKAPIVPETPNADVPGLVDSWFVGEYPNLHEAMTRQTTEKKKPREVHTIFWTWEAGCWKMSLKDRENGYEAWFRVVNFMDLLELLEVACSTGVAPWSKIKKWSKTHGWK